MSQQTKVGKHATIVTKNDAATIVRYWSTNVVTMDWANNTVTLDTGGWETATTKLRMNQASCEFGLGYRVHQSKGEWFVSMEDQNVPITYHYETESLHPRGETFRFSLDAVTSSNHAKI
jgi:hypothetical protein